MHQQARLKSLESALLGLPYCALGGAVLRVQFRARQRMRVHFRYEHEEIALSAMQRNRQKGKGVDITITNHEEVERRFTSFALATRRCRGIDIFVDDRIVDDRLTGSEHAHVRVAINQLLVYRKRAASCRTNIRQVDAIGVSCW